MKKQVTQPKNTKVGKFNLGKIRSLLMREQEKVQEDLKALDADDPLMDNGLAESSEPGTDSWLADTHGRVVAMKNNMQDMLQRTKKAILNLNAGKYGKCDNCGKAIEEKRLKAMPTATLCISCSNKVSKR